MAFEAACQSDTSGATLVLWDDSRDRTAVLAAEERGAGDPAADQARLAGIVVRSGYSGPKSRSVNINPTDQRVSNDPD